MADTMKGLKRTHYCGTVTPEMIGREVVVCGWAQKTRDMGTLVFIDLRDRTGIVQLAFDDKTDPALLAKAQKVRAEYVLMARGVLRQRESVNHEIPTGEVEVYVTELRVLAESNTPPFAISDDSRGVKEDLRLKYRYLDLRRPEMQNAIAMRHRIVKIARDYYDTNGFYEIETPILIKSTPEGARDYLVPSRVQQGRFYALPQSPQLYKQILMCSGFDRYMQIARCFRDEDLRADRQPEFTQIDLEMSFIDEEDIMAMNEGFMKRIFKEVLGKDLETPFRRIKYQDAMDNYGIDKPDTRFDLKLHDLSEILKNTEFSVFAGAIAGGGSVRGYKYQSLGPHDRNGDPLGGLSFTDVSLEARFRITESFGIVPFVDGGMVYETTMPDWGRDLSWGVGLGFRYYTLIGPIRLDIATPLQDRDNNKAFQIYLSIGQAF